jgi:hypothetical protein
MFDTHNHFEMDLFGQKQCTVRWPTDEEWIERSIKNKAVRYILSGGRFRNEMPDADSLAVALVDKIRESNDGESALSPEECSEIVSRLDRTEIDDCVREGDAYVVTMTVCGGVETVHRLRCPTLKQARTYGRESVAPVQMARQIVTTLSLAPGGALYDALLVSVAGYIDGVAPPVNHKDAAVTEILRVMSASSAEGVHPEK